jgi:hypothetical protein
MGRRARAAIVLTLPAVAVVTGGCSVLVDLSDTTSGDGSDGGARVDAGRPADGAIDAMDAMDAMDATEAETGYPAGSWCAQNGAAATFCEDFDFGPLGARWTTSTTLLQIGGDAGHLSTTAAVSLPYGFEIAAPALTPTTYLLEVLSEDTPAASQITLAFDFEALTLPPSGALYLGNLVQGSGSPRSALQFRVGPGLTDLQEQIILDSGAMKAGTGQWESSTLIPTGRWTRVAMSIDFTTAPATAALALDGQRVVTATLDPAWVRQVGSVDLGDWYVTPGPAFDVAYDNVVITATP